MSRPVPRRGNVPPVGPAALAALAGCLALTGCPRPTSPGNPDESANLARIQVAYSQATRELKRPPANLAELRPRLQQFGDPDAILRSPRDGQPYGIVWKVDLRNVRPEAPPVLAYEQQGAGGKRYVLTALGILPMTDEEFARQALPR